MSKQCTNSNHRFTVDSAGDLLATGLDLIPGRRCMCGMTVIITRSGSSIPSDYFRIAHIHSGDAALFAQTHPSLKTW